MIEHTDRIELPLLVLQTNALPLGYVCLMQRCKDSNPDQQVWKLLCYHYTTPLSQVEASNPLLLFTRQAIIPKCLLGIWLSFQPVRPALNGFLGHCQLQAARSTNGLLPFSGTAQDRTAINGFSVRHLDHIGNCTKQKSLAKSKAKNLNMKQSLIHSPAIGCRKPTETERSICVLFHLGQKYKINLN